MDENSIKTAVSDVMSDFYNEVMKKRFDNLDTEITDLRLTSQALVKSIDYSRLETKVSELERRLKKLESS